MSNELTLHDSERTLVDIQKTDEICHYLMQSGHYAKIGKHGIIAIIHKAKSVGVDTFDALNGGMHYINGKVEMSAAMMNQLIRQNKHSITKDEKSDATICILHGKRSDNGDTWSESFSMNDAILAGLHEKDVWKKYPRDMMFARALSRLAKQLFPDVIKGCWVEGELPNDIEIVNTPKNKVMLEILNVQKPEPISDEQYTELEEWMGDNLTLRQNILAYIKRRWDIDTLQEMPPEIYDHALNRAKQQRQQSEEHLGEQEQMSS